MGGHLNGGPRPAGRARPGEGHRRRRAERPARRQARPDRRHEREAHTRPRCPTTAGRRGRSSSHATCSGSRAAFFNWNGGSNFTDNPARQGAAPGARRLGPLRRPVRRDPGDASSSRRARTCRATSRAATSGIGRPTSRPSPPTSTRSRACAPPRRAPTASWSTAGAARAAARSRTTSSRSRSGWTRGTGITVEDLRAERAGRISFTVGPRRKLTVELRRPGDPGRDRADRLPRQLRVAGPLHQRAPARPSATRRRPRTRRGSSGTASAARSAPGPTPAARSAHG